MTLDGQKKSTRKAAFAARKQVFETQLAGQSALLSEFLAGHRSVPTAGYMPINTEISPLAAMAEQSAYGEVSVPVIQRAGLPLKFALWEPDIAMVDGDFGAKIPQDPTFTTPQIVILPLVAWDASGNRLGYGGGFYDRSIEGLKTKGAILAVGFAFDEQEVDAVPTEATDQPLDMMITQSRVLTFG
ncbi:5-formyltetrahydrofolate cyclo-ligase [Algirhabdus cladophorae]|uniref:5-formyltetrahydrofolate cyclo-ligase n=1 Tax=Algirhabdus cladophorae TaxID=3377108 RepID=UPI003B84A808